MTPLSTKPPARSTTAVPAARGDVELSAAKPGTYQSSASKALVNHEPTTEARGPPSNTLPQLATHSVSPGSGKSLREAFAAPRISSSSASSEHIPRGASSPVADGSNSGTLSLRTSVSWPRWRNHNDRGKGQTLASPPAKPWAYLTKLVFVG
jgi:hypothetical protein